MDVLRAKWGNLVFGTVTRNVARAQDLSLWYKDPGAHPDTRRYLGDNRAVLDLLTPTERRTCVTWEYDYFYGFCTPLGGGRDSLHYASPNAAQLDFLQGATGDWIDDYRVCLPTLGSMVCGVPTRSDRGITLERWWVCPRAFYVLWKLVMDDTSYGLDHNVTDDMRRLHADAPWGNVFQAIGARLVFRRAIPDALKNELPLIDGENFIDAFTRKNVALK